MTKAIPELASFDQWSALGYKIKKGSKATWIEGKAIFTNKQVEKYQPKGSDDYYDEMIDAFGFDRHWGIND